MGTVIDVEVGLDLGLGPEEADVAVRNPVLVQPLDRIGDGDPGVEAAGSERP